MPKPFDTPIALIVFNRPDLTAELLTVLRKLQPTQLFIIADGPRKSRPDDIENCKAVRQILRTIDWECEIFENFAQKNLGSRNRPISGLTWVFQNVNEAIILEDDCIPDLSFFSYCAELLDYYRNSSQVGIISGTNPSRVSKAGPQSYSFSTYPLIWGWATWKRTWDLYESNISESWSNYKHTGWQELLPFSTPVRRHWLFHFDLVSRGKFDAWDYQLTFAMLKNKLVAAIPRENLISNKGFGSNATHTINIDDPLSNLPIRPLHRPLIHPEKIVKDLALDALLENQLFNMSLIRYLLMRLIYQIGLEGLAKKTFVLYKRSLHKFSQIMEHKK